VEDAEQGVSFNMYIPVFLENEVTDHPVSLKSSPGEHENVSCYISPSLRDEDISNKRWA